MADIELSAQRHRDRLRIRGRIMQDGYVTAAHLQNYDLSRFNLGRIGLAFTKEFRQVAGVSLDHHELFRIIRKAATEPTQSPWPEENMHGSIRTRMRVRKLHHA